MPVPKLYISISLHAKQLWDRWNVRGAILFSLFLQVVLIFIGPIRKSARNQIVVLFIWFAYLMADTAANFAVGQISNSQRNFNQTVAVIQKVSNSQSSNSTKLAVDDNPDLLAFWAPFLLVHLGGPDTITAFALEDNQLWLRHLLSLAFQAGAVLYVFIQSLPNDLLWIPTLLMFTAGIIKYIERTKALYLASLDKFRDSMLEEPDPGPNYAKLMEEYAFKQRNQLPTRINMTPEPDKEAKASDVPVKSGTLNHVEVVRYAHAYFKTFKGLVVDLIFSFRERDESRDFFYKRSAEEALRLIEVELNFLYGTLYTKVEVVHSKIGYVFRFFAFGAVLSTLGIFYFQTDKSTINGVDIAITYTLLLGAIALDVIAFFHLIFSDRTIALIKNPDRPRGWWRRSACFVFNGYLALKKPRWHSCKCKTTNSGRHVSQNVLVTPTGFRRWSGSISTHNIIRYCLCSKTTTIHEFPSFLGIMFGKMKIPCFLRNKHDDPVPEKGNSSNGKVTNICKVINLPLDFLVQKFRFFYKPWDLPFKDFMDELLYVSSEPFTKELWKFIFEEIQNKAEFADTPETAKRISSARGDWVLTDTSDGNSQVQDEVRSNLLKYVSDVPYDESILLWHIATDLCYYDNSIEENLEILDRESLLHREFSKILSDYMLYLLIFQPTMMSAVAGIGKIRYRDTCAEARIFFERRGLGPNRDRDACIQILGVNTDVGPATVKGDRSKSVLFEACILAKELKRLGSQAKWKLTSRVWVELVSYAASHCRANTHAAQVSKGGELITFFWLLMAHFGLGEQFQINEGHARAKLLVGK
ncbi:hypothetical protein CCACVL1_08756 [Corchorus capsularis]|uniref:DUF4220 domain-containing protein n=1 Tax=Corchorus capsularis TaxID=210143 RepID=A0A1R3IZ18_COCAP|nr:hypothetical protein CCACVL1_08756 [Corchorus capsularis]